MPIDREHEHRMGDVDLGGHPLGCELWRKRQLDLLVEVTKDPLVGHPEADLPLGAMRCGIAQRGGGRLLGLGSRLSFAGTPGTRGDP